MILILLVGIKFSVGATHDGEAGARDGRNVGTEHLLDQGVEGGRRGGRGLTGGCRDCSDGRGSGGGRGGGCWDRHGGCRMTFEENNS